MDSLFRVLVQNSSDALVMLNADASIRFASETSARLLGYTAAERIGQSAFELLHPDDAVATRASFAECVRHAGVPFPLEYRLRHKDGSWRHIESTIVNRLEDPAVAAIVVNYRDVTDRRAAEEALRRSEARYRSLIQGAAYGIYRATPEGQILDANPALAAMLGYTVDELQSLNMSAIYKSPGDRTALIDRYRRARQESMATDVTWQRKDGTLIIVHLTARVVDFGDGLNCFEGVVEDITEKHVLEEQLRQALKMEAVGRLARGVAHDFNNVLAAIIGSSDLLSMRLKAGHPAREEADEIRKAAERGAALTHQLLAFSRSQALEAKLLDLRAVVLGLESMMQRLAGNRVVVAISGAGGPALVQIEPGQFEQLLINLVVNARDAMPEGGTVHVRVEPIHLDPRGVLRYPGIADGAFVRLAVSDTGCGIHPDMQPHVFEPFFTTKGPSKGTGLGLSIVYGIAKEAGGTVSFFTAPNQGTTFEVLLPLAHGA
jgi:two-component system cell cycle sensor histidine kinase/response regulator CckA